MKLADRLVAELRDLGVTARVERRKRHPTVVFIDAAGRERRYGVPATPSDHRSYLNCRAAVRRLVREGGPT